jgi:uncharacterized protein (TIRG00374 family)
MNLRISWRWLVWLLLPFLLWWVWRDIPFEQVENLLLGLDSSHLLTLIGLNLLLTLVFSLRWWLILYAMGYQLPYIKLAIYRLAGFAVSFLTPGPQFGGEPLQVFALKTKGNVDISDAVASVVLDKSIELLVNFTFLTFGIFYVFFSGLLPGNQSVQAMALTGALVFMPAGYLAMLWLDWRPISTGLGILTGRKTGKARLHDWYVMVRDAEDQAAHFCRCKPFWLISVVFVSLMVWGGMVFEFHLAFRFLGLHLTLQQVIFTMVLARIAMLLPLPGGVGPVEASQVWAIGMLGFDSVYAVGVMLLARARDLSLAGIGMLFALSLTHDNLPEKIPVPEKIQTNLGGNL